MKRIKTALVAILVLLVGLWLTADTLLPQPLTYFSFRTAFVHRGMDVLYRGSAGSSGVDQALSLPPIRQGPQMAGGSLPTAGFSLRNTGQVRLLGAAGRLAAGRLDARGQYRRRTGTVWTHRR